MRCGILVAVGAFAPMLAGAQATTATLHGVVLSADERAPLAAWIEVRNRESGATRRALSDSKGVYRILGLSPGAHDVVAPDGDHLPGQGQHERHPVHVVDLGEPRDVAVGQPRHG